MIGVISLLAGLLFPVLAKSRETAREIQCRSNLHQLIQGVMCFAADNQTLPGGYSDRARVDPTQRDWLAGSSANWQTTPQSGTIFPYVGQNATVYRCPSLEASPHKQTTSNGQFDYTFFLSFTGARLSAIKSTSRYTWPDAHQSIMPTPVLTEEDPWYFMNHLMGSAGSHLGGDSVTAGCRMGHAHRNGCNYAAVDGSVQWFNEPAAIEGANRWQSVGLSGKWVNLGMDITWGWWNHQ